MLSSFIPVASGATLALMALSASAAPGKSFWKLQSRQQQASGTPLFLDEPSCNSYQCTVVYYPGDNATAHWLDAPSGNVNLTMISHYTNMTDQFVAVVPGTTTNCATEGGSTCGQFSWIVPSTWAGGNFTLQAQSVSDPSLESYTDTILVMAGNATSNSLNVAFSALDPTISGSSTVGGVATTASSPASTTPASGTATSAPAGAAPSSTNAAATSTPATSSGSGSTSGAAGSYQQPVLMLTGTVALVLALCL